MLHNYNLHNYNCLLLSYNQLQSFVHETLDISVYTVILNWIHPFNVAVRFKYTVAVMLSASSPTVTYQLDSTVLTSDRLNCTVFNVIQSPLTFMLLQIHEGFLSQGLKAILLLNLSNELTQCYDTMDMWFKKDSAQHGARTHDPEIKSLMLYRLS